ncbi:gluconate 2-dehydrogenase subunit 3 family protein [Arthrobacter sp. LAPM80]|uniref:gluconate 2-dehydrogenase subunit 3 family protein n=1 Tax=Arthrobacter sp. LAPM80 TaxID=3141788 RepID=UPI00398B7069
MTALPLDPKDGGGRFPGFDAQSQSGHWDQVTQGVVLARLGRPADLRFFSPAEEAAARALFDQLLNQRHEPRVPVVNLVDSRLAEDQTDGWHYEGMEPDPEAWRSTLADLDAEARARSAVPFVELSWGDQEALLTDIHDAEQWRGRQSSQVWSLWTRYACTAFYSHPMSWNEIGFAGPAYPRGYKNLGLEAREPFEVADARPEQDPASPRTKSGKGRRH